MQVDAAVGCRRPVLDVGAGSGIFSRQLLDAGVAKSASCVDIGYPDTWEEDHNGRPIRFVKAIENFTQDLVIMMDVLEHVEDDLALLQCYSDPLPRNGRVVITVPAFQWMWSGHDVFLEHYRRYTLEQVEDLVRRAGLEVEKSAYFFGMLFPVAAAVRFSGKIFSNGSEKNQNGSDLKSCPDLLNKLLIAVNGLEQRTIFRFNRVAGLSVFCLARR